MQRSDAFNYEGTPQVFLSSDKDVINEGEHIVVCVNVTLGDEWLLPERVDLTIKTVEHDSNGNTAFPPSNAPLVSWITNALHMSTF